MLNELKIHILEYMKMLDVMGARLRFEDSGRSHGPAVLLLNALGTDYGLWDEQRAALERSFRVLRFDARGHGKSIMLEGAPAAASIDDLLQDACKVLDAAGVERAHWCGVSLGGMIALRAATTVPQRVVRLVLANTAAHLPPSDAWQARIDTVTREGMAPIAAAVAARWFTPEFISGQGARVECVLDMVRTMQPSGYAACCAAIRDMDQRESLSAVQAPTLVIAGARDPATPPELADLLVSRIPGSDLTVLDASHLSCIEQSEDFSAAVMDFLHN